VAKAPDTRILDRDNIAELIEHSFTPLLVTDRNKIAVANSTARGMLGNHIVGQDVRMTFRQPEAIALIAGNRNGSAIVRGLVRRRDIWRVNRQSIGGELAVVELINQTAEADISRAHTDFVANASHELRTPLASIIGYVETLSDDADNIDRATSDRFLTRIKQEASRLQSLVSDLMSLSRVEAEKHDLPDKVFDLGPTVERAAREGAGPDRLNRLDLKVERALPVRGDEQQIEQLVRNLVDNAMKYGASDKPVTVGLEKIGDNQVQLSVQDRGEGIAPEHLPHLTRRFYRTDPGRSRASGGTGLGLAIVKHIVERHRGRLDIESTVGVGTTVTVRLPLQSEAGTETD
jgi:two-component system phosphate regulon sensor histidine kinase PhoR